MIEDTWRINDLKSGSSMLCVTDVEGLSGERIRLNLHIGLSDGVDEGRFSYIWESCDKDGSFIRINTWKSTKMFPNFLKIGER